MIGMARRFLKVLEVDLKIINAFISEIVNYFRSESNTVSHITHTFYTQLQKGPYETRTDSYPLDLPSQMSYRHS